MGGLTLRCYIEFLAGGCLSRTLSDQCFQMEWLKKNDLNLFTPSRDFQVKLLDDSPIQSVQNIYPYILAPSLEPDYDSAFPVINSKSEARFQMCGISCVVIIIIEFSSGLFALKVGRSGEFIRVFRGDESNECSHLVVAFGAAVERAYYVHFSNYSCYQPIYF